MKKAKKTLVIGIGGTGLTAIRELRRLIAENYEQGLQDPNISSVKFIYLDTHEEDINTLNWSVLGKDIRLTDGEKVIITGDRLSAMIENPEDYENINPWLPRIKNYLGDPGAGAKGIRPYGRLIYEYSENNNKVKNCVFDCYNTLNQSFKSTEEWKFYLVCGLSGGTGSGMFLPLARDLENWNVYQRGTATNKKFYSFLILPPLQITSPHDRYHPNAYAALSELNYLAFKNSEDTNQLSFSDFKQLPFDNCYLLETQNERGLDIGLNNLPLLIAQRIFLNIQGGEAASHIDTIMDNPQLGNLKNNEDPDRKHSLRFSTFGLSTVSYPKEIVAKCLAYSLAKQVVSNWLKEGDYAENINQQVKSELTSIRLSRSHICGDADPYGINDHPDRENEINNLVDRELQGKTKKQLGENADKIRLKIEKNFRNNDSIREFYQQRLRDVSGAAKESLQQTRFKITSFLSNSELGITYAKRFLEELINILNEHKADVSNMASAASENRIRTLQNNLAETISQVRINEQKFMYGNRAFQIDLSSISDELKDYLKSIASFSAGKYGLAFLNQIIPQIEQLRAELDVWDNRIVELKDKLSGSLQTILEDIKKGTKENGKTIFSEQSLEKLVEESNSQIIQTSIEDIIKDKLEQNDNLDLTDLIKITQPEPEELIYESSYQWVLSENCPVDVKRLTLYDKFIQEYNKPQLRQKILSDAKNLSAPFLKFTPSEVEKIKIEPTKADVTAIPDGTGSISSNGKPTQTVIQSDLEAIGVPSNKIKIAEDRERIIFLQEKQVFPLRWIEILSKLKGEYDNFSEKVALHIDRNVEPYLYDLYLLSSDEKKNSLEAEEVWIIARAFNWIECKTNPRNRKEEILYEFEEAKKAGIQKRVLGFNWDNTFEAFVQDAILRNPKNPQLRDARERLTSKIRELRKQAVSDLTVIDEIKTQLNCYLQDRSDEYELKTYDLRYEKAQKIINRIFDSL
jgi:hypothetical protein